jgi:hypothetical protein
MKKLAFVCALLASLGINAVSQVSSTRTETNSGPASEGMPTACDGKNFPIDKGGSPSCCRLGDQIFQVTPKPGQLFKTLAHRQLGPRACSDSNGKTNCVDAQCYFGPCGTHTVETWQGLDAKVFVPHNQPQVCGYQVTKGRSLIVRFPPDEPYTDQKQYESVTASCPYTRCLQNGVPAVTLTVTAETQNATGNIVSSPSGITLSGAGTASAAFEQTVTLTAEPKGSHALARFSGNCVQIGPADFGQKTQCTVPLAPDPVVTVTYVCYAGLSCDVNEPITRSK